MSLSLSPLFRLMKSWKQRQMKASTEALAFSGIKSVAPNEDQSFRHVVSVAFSMRLLVRQRLSTILIAEDLTD